MRKRDKLAKEKMKLVSSPSIFGHFEYIEELGCKDCHFLYITSFPPVFIDYQTPVELVRYCEAMGKNTLATK